MACYYNENDPYAVQWLRNLIAAGHIAAGEVDERSIEDVRPVDLRGFTQCHFFAGIGVWSHALRRAGWPDDRPVWTGSCPCQPFSSAGKGLGVLDERHLWPHWFHLIGECRPPVVFGEQVASKDAEPWIDLVQNDMEALDYAFGAVPFPAASVGAPHIRDRLYWVADTDANRRTAAPGAELHDTEHHAQPCGGACQLGNAHHQGLALGSLSDDGGRVVRLERSAASPAEPVRGFWAGADWIACRDGKWRPVEPGAFPLVDGSAFRLDSGSSLAGKSRIGMLRAAGNAIVAPAAAVFISAAMEFFDAAI